MPRVHNYALKIPWAHVGRGARLRHAPGRGSTALGAADFIFLFLAGLHPSKGLFGSSIAAQLMQEPGKQTSHAAFRKSQVVSITSSIPVSHTILQLAPGADMLNSPIYFAYRTICIVSLS